MSDSFKEICSLLLLITVTFFIPLFGWVANIYKIAMCNLPLAEWTILEVLRIAGIVIYPIGSVLGFI